MSQKGVFEAIFCRVIISPLSHSHTPNLPTYHVQLNWHLTEKWEDDLKADDSDGIPFGTSFVRSVDTGV